MSIGTAETLDYKDLRGDFYAGAQRLSPQIRRILAARSLADPAHSRHHRRCHHHRVPHLEAQT